MSVEIFDKVRYEIKTVIKSANVNSKEVNQSFKTSIRFHKTYNSINMLHKQSLSRLSHVRKIVHDIKPQTFHTINLTRNAETRANDSKNFQLSVQHSNLSINRRLNTSKRLLFHFGESRNALQSNTSENKSLPKVTFVIHW